jgi:predicted glutamine amidotransferase
MCRIVAYFGKKSVLMRTLIYDPVHSLIKQSKAANEGRYGINADGFGVSWYNHSIDEYPAIFRSTQPAWNDANLIHLTEKVHSNCFLGHVRASTVGDVALNNCHPFAYKKFSFVHNGTIREFNALKRSLMDTLSDELYASIISHTDSEHFFYLIMQFYDDGAVDLVSAAKKAFEWIKDKQAPHDEKHFSRINIALTDGHQFLATRYGNTEKDLLSLHYAILLDKEDKVEAVVVASEPLTEMEDVWKPLEENQYLYIRQDFSYEVGDLPA